MKRIVSLFASAALVLSVASVSAEETSGSSSGDSSSSAAEESSSSSSADSSAGTTSTEPAGNAYGKKCGAYQGTQHALCVQRLKNKPAPTVPSKRPPAGLKKKVEKKLMEKNMRTTTRRAVKTEAKMKIMKKKVTQSSPKGTMQGGSSSAPSDQ